MALVFDRILLIVFTTVSVTGTIAILAQRKQHVAPAIDLSNLDQGVFNACDYRQWR